MAFARNFRQTMTYWAPTGHDTYGKPTFASPTTYACRWEDKQELFRDKKGQEVISKSKVYTGATLNIDGYLFLGTSVAADPTVVNGAWEIRMIGVSPDLRAIRQLNVATL